MTHALHEFVETWDALEYEGEVRWFSRLGLGMSLGGRAHSPADLAGRLSANRRGFNCYVQLNPSIGVRTKRPGATQVTHYRGFLFDIDPDPGVQSSPLAALDAGLAQLERAIELPLTPWIIDSGRGAQAWILGDVEPLAEGDYRVVRAAVSHLVKGLDLPKGHHADPSVCDVSRIARLPGTVNTKTGRTARVRQRGTAIVGLRQRLIELAPAIEDQAEHEFTATADSYRQVYQHLTLSAQNFIEQGWAFPGRHSMLWHTADLLKRHGLSRAAVARALLLGARQCRPKLTCEDVVYALNRTFGPRTS